MHYTEWKFWQRAMIACAIVAAAQLPGPATALSEEPNRDLAVTAPPPKHKPSKAHNAKHLTGDSTLADWRRATPSARSHMAVAIARNHLAPTATKLEVATTAIEITGCLSKTAADNKFDAWKVTPTALTCLNAPEKPAKEIPKP